MKLIKLSAFALSVMALGLGSCAKEADVTPASEINNAVSATKVTNLNNAQAKLHFSVNPVAEGGTVTITASHTQGDGGTIYLQEFDGIAWVNLTTNPYTILVATAEDNGRKFRAFFDKTNGMDFYSSEITLKVGNSCDFALTPNTTQVALENDVYTFSTTYTIQTCDRAVNGFKLQGGLTNGAMFDAALSTDGASEKKTGNGKNANSVITWYVRDMGMYDTESFTVVYTKPIKCGSGLQNITGSWSAKGTFVDDNTYAELGYNNQQTYMPVACN